jgi:hypothetical protein
VTELVTSIGHRDGLGAWRHDIPRENACGLRTGERGGIDAELRREIFIDADQLRSAHGCGRGAGVESFGKSGVAVIELYTDGHTTQVSAHPAPILLLPAHISASAREVGVLKQ